MAAGWSKLSLFDQCPRRPGTCHHFCTTPSSESALLFLLLCWLWVMWWLGGEFKAVIFSKFWNLTLLNWGPLSGNNSAGILNCLFNYVISQPKAKVTRFEFVSHDIVHKIILYASNASCYLDLIPPLIFWLRKVPANLLQSLHVWSTHQPGKLHLSFHFWKRLDIVFSNFRPMGNLPFVAKIAEKAIILQILGHCEKHAQPPTNQSSYQQYHSTETALLQVHNNILMNMDQQEITLLVLVYFNSAFDTIYYSTTGNILENDFGILGFALSWLMSFLSPRQHVVIDNAQSRDFLVLVHYSSSSMPHVFSTFTKSINQLSSVMQIICNFSWPTVFYQNFLQMMLFKAWRLLLLNLELGWQVIIFLSMTVKPNLSSLDLRTSGQKWTLKVFLLVHQSSSL